MNFSSALAYFYSLIMTSSPFSSPGIAISGGWCFYNQIYNPTSPSESVFGQPASLKPVYGATASRIADRFYIIGGWSYVWPNQFQRNVQILNSDMSASQGTAMGTARVVHSATVIDDQIMVCGGMYAWGYHLSSCALYNPDIGLWKTVASMPGPRVDHASVTIKGKVYVVGGVANGAYSRSLWIYDPATNTWSTGAETAEYRDVPAAIVHDDKLVVCGGWDNANAKVLNSCEVYDPATNTWSKGADMQQPRYGMQMADFQGVTYILGGMGHEMARPNETKWLKSVEKYDFENNQCELLDSELPAACTGFVVMPLE